MHAFVTDPVMSSGPPEPVPAEALTPGARFRVRGVCADAQGVRARLLAMGLTPGVTFTVRSVAPMGDPLVICVRGFVLSLRRAEAAILHLVPESPEEGIS